jgi:lipopolysaccharide export system protein LptA
MRLLASLLVALVFFLAILSAPARAATGSTSQNQLTGITPSINNKSPIHITADKMVANQQARTIVFQGHVCVRQNDLTITSNLLTVTMAQQNPKQTPNVKQPANNDSNPSQRIDYIDFKGDVKVTQQDRVATAQEAIFYQKQQKILLEGSPVVTKGQDRIQGKLITIYLKDNRCVVEGGGGAQVRAVLFPEKKQ